MHFSRARRRPTWWREPMMEDSNAALAAHIVAAAKQRSSTLIVGLCGAQGSGKSTRAAQLQSLLEEQRISTAVISIDDLYLTRSERVALGVSVHPLLQTRGVPGTHDVALGLQVLDALGAPGVVAIPSFDKSLDDRRPQQEWPKVRAPVKVILLEGWCVGALPQEPALLITPVNALERELDADGSWRRYVNDALAGAYRQLFGRLDLLILLKAPSFDVVYGWRLEQEHKLREQVAREGGVPARVMSDQEVLQFISHYERLTRHILSEMPSRADVVVELGSDRSVKRFFAQSPNACK